MIQGLEARMRIQEDIAVLHANIVTQRAEGGGLNGLAGRIVGSKSCIPERVVKVSYESRQRVVLAHFDVDTVTNAYSHTDRHARELRDHDSPTTMYTEATIPFVESSSVVSCFRFWLTSRKQVKRQRN